MEIRDLTAALTKYADKEIAPQLSTGRRWAFCGSVGAACFLLEAKAGKDLPLDKAVLGAFFASAFAASPKVTINPKTVLGKLMPGADSGVIFDMIAAPLDMDLTFDKDAADKLLEMLP